MAGLPDGQSPTYSSASAMTIGFCVQICFGNDPTFNYTSLMGLQVMGMIHK